MQNFRLQLLCPLLARCWLARASKQHYSSNLTAAIVGLTIQTTIGSLIFVKTLKKTFVKTLVLVNQQHVKTKVGVISKSELGENSQKKNIIFY